MFLYDFPRFSLIGKVLQKVSFGTTTGIIIFPYRPSNTGSHYCHNHSCENPLSVANDEGSTGVAKAETRSELSVTTKDSEVLPASWRKSTKTQYSSSIHRWFMFGSERNKKPHNPTVALTVDFLTDLYESGLGYTATNTARSAWSSFILIDNVPASQLSIVRRILKGVFNLRPVLAKSNVIWDVSTVLNHLKNLSPDVALGLNKLTLKSCML